MLNRILGLLTCGILAVTMLQSGLARNKTAKASTTVTGCLAKGDSANEYSIRAEDGKTYGLRSSKVQLAEHLNHKVTVTGTINGEKERSTAASKNGKPEEDLHLKVSSLKMVSTTCP